MTAAAFSAEYAAHFASTVRYASCSGVRDPENLAQEVWAHAWERREQYEGRDGATFSTWVGAITRNAIALHWRRRATHIIEYVAEYPVLSSPPTKCNELILTSIMERVRLGDRAMLAARYIREQPLEQMAAEAGVNLSTLKNRLHRGLLAARAAA